MSQALCRQRTRLLGKAGGLRPGDFQLRSRVWISRILLSFACTVGSLNSWMHLTSDVKPLTADGVVSFLLTKKDWRCQCSLELDVPSLIWRCHSAPRATADNITAVSKHQCITSRCSFDFQSSISRAIQSRARTCACGQKQGESDPQEPVRPPCLYLSRRTDPVVCHSGTFLSEQMVSA